MNFFKFSKNWFDNRRLQSTWNEKVRSREDFRLPFFICFFVSFFIGGFVGSFLTFFVEKFHPNKKSSSPSTIRFSQNANQFDEDIKVIVSFGKSLENLPMDALPKASDLEYPIARIEEAIGRLKSNRRVPRNMMQALSTSENLLILFKTEMS